MDWIYGPEDNEKRRSIARAISKHATNDRQKRKSIYIEALSDMGLPTNCCEEGICGGSPTDTRLFR